MSDDFTVPTAAYSKSELVAWSALEEAADMQLERRMGDYHIPILPYEPADDTMLVYRLPAEEKKTEAGLVLPEFQFEVEEQQRWQDGGLVTERKTTRHDVVLNVGLIVSAGNAACDWMRSHGILVGDLIKFSRYSGEEENARWFGPNLPESTKDMLQLNVREVKGSFDLWVRIHGPTPTMKKVFAVDDGGNGIHVFKPILKEKSANG